MFKSSKTDRYLAWLFLEPWRGILEGHRWKVRLYFVNVVKSFWSDNEWQQIDLIVARKTACVIARKTACLIGQLISMQSAIGNRVCLRASWDAPITMSKEALDELLCWKEHIRALNCSTLSSNKWSGNSFFCVWRRKWRRLRRLY